MSKPAIILHAVIKARIEIRCRKCEMPTYSEVSRVESHRPITIENIEATINSALYEQPVGWSSYGRGVYQCPDCTKAETHK